MSRAKIIHSAALAVLAFFAMAMPASPGMVPADALPLPNRVAGAEIVVVGKVTAFEEKTVMVAPFPGAKTKTEFKIAVITVSDPLMAPKGTKTIRIGFVPPQPMVVVSPPPFQATIGQEGCFFLTKLGEGEGDFFVPRGQLGFLDKKNASFDKDIALVKRCVKILEDPNAALKGKNGEDRFLAAGMLVARYTTRKSPNAKAEPIDAEQSKLILQALAAADWTSAPDMMQLSPLMVLYRLPLTAKDGWTPPSPKNQAAYAAYIQQWLRDHADSYRIQRFVAEKSK
jgi:hypothetical protein